MAGIARLEHHVSELLAHLKRHRGALVYCVDRRRNGQPISATFVQGAVNKIIAKSMNKKPHMRWNWVTVQPLPTCEQCC
jgi:hypothetical protein